MSPRHRVDRLRRAAVLAFALAVLPSSAWADPPTEWNDLYGDGFESGGFAAWDAVNNGGGDLTVTAPAALVGAFGLQAVVNDTAGLFVQDNTPADEGYYRARFRFDPNAFDPGEAEGHFRTRIFIGLEDGPRRLFAVVLRRMGGQYALRGRARLDDNRQADTPFVPITDAAHDVELRWKRSSGPDANDGTFELSVDGGAFSVLSGLDNSMSSLDFVRMGALSVKTGAAGTLYWDAFASFRRADPLFCETPFDGAHVTVASGVTLPLSGRSRGLTDVQVNGVPVAVAPDGTFSTTVPGRYGLHFVELSGLDAGRPHRALCTFLGSARSVTEGQPVDDAVGFRFQPAGVNKLFSLVPGWYARPAFAQEVHNLFAGSSWQFGGGPGSDVEITYESLTYHLDSATATIVNGSTLNVHAQMDLRPHLDVDGNWLFVPVHTEGDVVLSNATVDFTIVLGIDPVTSRIDFHVGQILNTSPGTLSTTGFSAGQFQTDLMAWIANDFVDFALGQLALASTGGAGLFSGLSDGLATTVTGSGFPVGRLDGTGTVTLAFDAPAFYALWHDQGLDLGTALRVTTPAVPPGATGHVPLPTGLDALGRLLPGADAWASVSGGVFNLALQALWRAGLFDGTVPGGSLDAALPAGTSVDVTLRTMPVVTDFDPDGSAGLDVGSLDLVVTHPDLPSGLRVRAGGRLRAEANFMSDDLVFDGFVVDELHVATGDVVLAPVAQTALEALVGTLLRRVADIALNDSLPALPVNVFNLAPSMSAWGLPGGTTLRFTEPTLVPDTNRVFLSEGPFP